MRALLQLTAISTLLLLSSGHPYYHLEYTVRFLHKEDCNNCLDVDSECFKSVSQCANLGFRYFNVTVHSYVAKCTARKILLLLELKKLEQEKGDSVHLDVCIGGKRKYSFWSYPVCYTTTELEEGGREAVFISCSKANNTHSSHDPSTSATVPIWVLVVVTVLAVLVVIVLLGTCAYQCYRCKTGRTAGQERPIRDPPSGDGEANIGHSGDSASLSPSTQARYCFSGCLANKRLVSHNLLRPTAYTSPLATAQNSDDQKPDSTASGYYQPIVDESDGRSAQPRRFSFSRWLTDKGLVPNNWFRPTARTVPESERQSPPGASIHNEAMQQLAEAGSNR